MVDQNGGLKRPGGRYVLKMEIMECGLTDIKEKVSVPQSESDSYQE